MESNEKRLAGWWTLKSKGKMLEGVFSFAGTLCSGKLTPFLAYPRSLFNCILLSNFPRGAIDRDTRKGGFVCVLSPTAASHSTPFICLDPHPLLLQNPLPPFTSSLVLLPHFVLLLLRRVLLFFLIPLLYSFICIYIYIPHSHLLACLLAYFLLDICIDFGCSYILPQ